MHDRRESGMRDRRRCILRRQFKMQHYYFKIMLNTILELDLRWNTKDY